jgi:hypothetical protein
MNENATLSDYITAFKERTPWASRHPMLVWVAVIAAGAGLLVALFAAAFGLVLGRFW